MSPSAASAATGSSTSAKWRVPAFDALLAATWFAVGVLQIILPRAELWEDSGVGSYRPAGVGTWLLTLVLCATLTVRRRVPTVAFCVGMAALTAMVLADYLLGLLPFICWMLIYSVGTRARSRQCLIAVGVTIGGLWLTWYSDYPDFDGNSVARNIGFFGVSLLAGRFVATSRRSSAALVELAEQRSVVSAQRAHSAVVEERLRLAQELHDIVAHSMSVISVQAAMGSAAFDAQPHQTRRALANIERTSSDTLRELRGLVGLLRHEDGTRAALAPAPSLRDIGTLIDNVETAGLATTLVTDGPLSLPPGVDAFGYRIVQEALTNVLKHAGARTVAIEIHDSDSVVTLRVCDDGRGSSGSGPAVSGGHGIVGMRERVATFGGTLHAGPAPDGGFEVSARLPYLSLLDDAEPVPAPGAVAP